MNSYLRIYWLNISPHSLENFQQLISFKIVQRRQLNLLMTIKIRNCFYFIKIGTIKLFKQPYIKDQY